MWTAVLVFLFILGIKILAKYIFYVSKDPRAARARRQEELRKRQLNARGEKRRPTGYYITGLTIYPVKSCKGIPVTSAEIGRYGFVNDRRWMIVDKETNRFLTQRQLPRMALLVPSLLNTTKTTSVTGKNASYLQLEGPGMESPLQVPIPHLNPKEATKLETNSSTATTTEDSVVEVTIWNDTVTAVDEGEASSQWLSTYLERPVRLVRLLHDNKRRVPKDYEVTDDDKVLNLTSFADGFPFLLANERSLQDLNDKLEKLGHDSLPMTRFRPNMIVAYHIEENQEEEAKSNSTPSAPIQPPEPFDEDGWKQIRIGGSNNGITFYLVKKCSRCKMTTVDPEKGEFTHNQKEDEKEEQPLALLRQYRTDDNGKTVFFAQNLIHSYHPSLQKQSVLVGDPVHIIERNEKGAVLISNTEATVVDPKSLESKGGVEDSTRAKSE